MQVMRRGEVWWVDFDPSLGSEIRKMRPAVIVSHDISNTYLNRCQVVPSTSNTGRLYPSEAFVMTDDKESKAMADQLTTASKERLKNKLCQLSEQDMSKVEHAIKVQLGLKP